MKSRPTANPTNRFHDVAVTYEDGDGPPPASVTLLADSSRSILSHNDSPDIGFSWSANPYRGCLHACAYCVGADTRVLLANGRERRIAELEIGDEIFGTRLDGPRRYYTRTRVRDRWQTRKLAYRVALANGIELVASGDHRFLATAGWSYVMPHEEIGRAMTLNDPLLGCGRLAANPVEARAIEGLTVANAPGLRVVAIEALGAMDLYDITTGTGDFIANGVVSHNCYARPTHEYLDLGAGTDFDTKIVIKRDAPELLRAAFEKPSWKGELVMFSGVTDCYQAIEAELQLTRKCLEVCLEYKNPCAVISKSALVERDVDLFAALVKEAGCNVAVSLAWVDAELARAIEPWAPAPERRFKVIETLAKAGVPVSVMCAPIIPGLNDDQMVRVLERARDAGATGAGWVLLRLPGAVATVFEERVRAALPLAADKIMHRIRETRGGEKLYDPRFHARGRGQGVYAQTIASLFETTIKRLGMTERDESYEDGPSRFARPPKQTKQLSLF